MMQVGTLILPLGFSVVATYIHGYDASLNIFIALYIYGVATYIHGYDASEGSETIASGISGRNLHTRV